MITKAWPDHFDYYFLYKDGPEVENQEKYLVFIYLFFMYYVKNNIWNP